MRSQRQQVYYTFTHASFQLWHSLKCFNQRHLACLLLSGVGFFSMDTQQQFFCLSGMRGRFLSCSEPPVPLAQSQPDSKLQLTSVLGEQVSQVFRDNGYQDSSFSVTVAASGDLQVALVNGWAREFKMQQAVNYLLSQGVSCAYDAQQKQVIIEQRAHADVRRVLDDYRSSEIKP